LRKKICLHWILFDHGMGWSDSFFFFLHEDFMTFGSRAMATLILTQCTQNYAWGRYSEICHKSRLPDDVHELIVKVVSLKPSEVMRLTKT